MPVSFTKVAKQIHLLQILLIHLPIIGGGSDSGRAMMGPKKEGASVEVVTGVFRQSSACFSRVTLKGVRGRGDGK